MTNQSPLPNLETSLAEITAVIEKMEKGDLALDQSLEHFERGIALIKHCQKILTDAEQKVQLLIQNNQQEALIPFGKDHEGAPGEVSN